MVRTRTNISSPGTTEYGARVVQCVRHYVGCSLDHRLADLVDLIGREVDDGSTLLSKNVSTCGLFALSVWHAVGVRHHLVNVPYEVGRAITWLVEVAHSLDAVRYPHRDGPPPVGSLCHYWTKGTNNNHVEFVLEPVDTSHHLWLADHAGGGRPNCTVGEGRSDLLWSGSKPLQEYYVPDVLLTAFERVDDNEDTDDGSDVRVSEDDLDAWEGSPVAEAEPKAGD